MRLAITLALLLAVCSKAFGQCPKYTNIRIFSATALNAAQLQGTISSFQAGLGGQNNMNEIGPLFNGFRQINWDAPSDSPPFLPFDMPGNFFNLRPPRGVPRGAIFKARGGKFAVSNPDDNSDFQFSSLVGNQQSQRFTTFSEPRLFTPVKSNKVTTTFRIPGKNQRAVVSGFGAIFTDVVLAKRTTMTFFDAKGCKIVTLPVKPFPTYLSFAGIIVLLNGKPWPVISKVVIKLGTIAIARAGFGYSGKGDIVVLDDLLYGEPQVGKKPKKTKKPKPPKRPSGPGYP